MDLKQRFDTAHLVRDHYSGNFPLFLEDYFAFLGFKLSEMQADIAEFMQDESARKKCVMAGRGEAKSTIAQGYALWKLTQDPTTRVLVISAGDEFAGLISHAIIIAIKTWPLLSYLVPDKSMGDRTSTSGGFDVHYSLRGVDKQPSVKALGVTGQMTGNRADLLISDDVETPRLGFSAAGREQLKVLTKEYAAICTHGEVLYLGTPQTKDSIYNTLPSRGYCIRIWPSRFPTHEEEDRYAGRLAPWIIQQMQADPSLRTGYGYNLDKGRSTDLDRYSEQDLLAKFDEYQEHGFQLQFMLDTTLSDALRQQLKLEDLLIFQGGSTAAPESLHWAALPKFRLDAPRDFSVNPCALYSPAAISDTWTKYNSVRAWLDPAGSGSDESVCVVGANVGPYLYILGLHAYIGGQNKENIQTCLEFMYSYDCTDLTIEDNMGHGVVTSIYRSEADALARSTGKALISCMGMYVSGQKEKRILNTLAPYSSRHRLIISPEVLQQDVKHCLDRASKQTSYSLFYQFSSITDERGSLEHDDRLDALAGLAGLFKETLSENETAIQAKRLEAMQLEFIDNPMGVPRPKPQSTKARVKLR